MSDEAKDLISSLLTVDPNKRINAEQALNSKWARDEGSLLASYDLGNNLTQFRKYNAKRKLRQAVLTVSFDS